MYFRVQIGMSGMKIIVLSSYKFGCDKRLSLVWCLTIDVDSNGIDVGTRNKVKIIYY